MAALAAVSFGHVESARTESAPQLLAQVAVTEAGFRDRSRGPIPKSETDTEAEVRYRSPKSDTEV
jgi:hypothetical protein